MEGLHCKHCKDEISITQCSRCKKKLVDECLSCHSELKHDIVTDQNIHICGSPQTRLDGLDKDPDAFKPSWKSGN